MTTVKICENSHVEVFYRVGASPFTLITFAHLSFDSGGKNFWGEQMADRLDLDCIGFVAKTNNWYPRAAMLELLPAVQARLSRPVILYGHSMGAYAAIKYSRLLGATGSLASCPMTTIDPAQTPGDTRFHRWFDADIMSGMDISADDVQGRIVVIYDPYCKPDREHADTLRTVITGSNLCEIEAKFFEHEAVQILLERDILFSLIGFCFHGYEQKILLFLIRRLKRNSVKYLTKLGYHIVNHSRSPLTKRRIVKSLVAAVRASAQPDWPLLVIGNQLLANLELMVDNTEVAIPYIEEALQIEFDATGRWEKNMRAMLAFLYYRVGRLTESATIFRDLVERGEASDDHYEQALACATVLDDDSLVDFFSQRLSARETAREAVGA